MSSHRQALRDRSDDVRARVAPVERWIRASILFKIWERMLEIEFIDRGIALAGKAFVAFFPLVIVVAAFLPDHLRHAITMTLTHRLGITGQAGIDVKTAFAQPSEIRKAAGALGLILTFFYSSSFTTALSRTYMRAWRRPSTTSFSTYIRGPIWIALMIFYIAIMGLLRGALTGGGAGLIAFGIFVLITSSCVWTFTAWYMLAGAVRLRAFVATGVITGVAMGAYAMSASVWMPTQVINNQHEFGVFGLALSLVTWLSGAAICILLGACGGVVLVEDVGPLGRLCRFGATDLLMPGVALPLDAPTRGPRLVDAFKPATDGNA